LDEIVGCLEIGEGNLKINLMNGIVCSSFVVRQMIAISEYEALSDKLVLPNKKWEHYGFMVGKILMMQSSKL
jgi:hypothetical protein